MTVLTIRQVVYELSEKIDKKDMFRKFVSFLKKEVFTTSNEIILPMQLVEKMFDFDAHRGAVHPIASHIVRRFKKNGLRISKVRNKYLVRIKPSKK